MDGSYLVERLLFAQIKEKGAYELGVLFRSTRRSLASRLWKERHSGSNSISGKYKEVKRESYPKGVSDRHGV